MQTIANRLRQSASLKVFAIGVLIIVLLIPLAMIRGVIEERDQLGAEAKFDIQRTWGRPQLVAGPVLVIPYDVAHTTSAGETYFNRRQAYFLPESLSIDANVDSEVRYRGIHKVPVYSSQLRISGAFPEIPFDEVNIPEHGVDWDGVFVALGVSDGRAITESPDILIADQAVRFVPGGVHVGGFPPQIIAPVGKSLPASGRDKPLQFSVDLALNGSESLSFLPSGDTTDVSMHSPWPSPSFSGSYLPERREIGADGFTARWKVSSIGRPLPSRWTDASYPGNSADESAFGVELYMPISVYRLTLRATKYGVLFIGLTFVAYFLFEVVAGLRLHPLQYLLVGFANCLFYLLLVSLAEHIGFGLAYIASCVASSGLIIGYSLTVLGDRRRTLIMALVLGVLYSFLYMTLKAESYAMLAGSIGLWVGLGVVMYLTRRIDWYERNSTQRELL